MTWNYRAIRHHDAAGTCLAIHRVFYDDAGKVTQWSDEPVVVQSANMAELADVLVMMRRAAFLDPLDLTELEKRAKGTR